MSDPGGNVVTLDNFATLMPKLDAFDPKPLYALVDMGSNGIRFSISDLSPPRSRLLNCVYRERAGISLFDALHESRSDAQEFHFSEITIQRVAQTLQRFRTICDGYGVPEKNIAVFATEAMRTAKNRDRMLFAIKEASGLAVDILSPSMESLFGAMGARSGFDHVDGLFMDLGGGSVQMTYINSLAEEQYDILAAEAAKSLPFGAAKLTLAMSSQDDGHAAKVELRAGMKKTFDDTTARFPKLKEQAEHEDGITIYFCGGGFRGYGSMLMYTDPLQPYPIPTIGGYTVPGKRFIKWREMLHANSYDDSKIFGLSKRRREQFPAIAAVVEALVEAVPKVKKVVFCSGGNREGVLYMKLPIHVRETNPLTLLPRVVESRATGVIDAITATISSALTERCPAIFTKDMLRYFAAYTWHEMGDSNGTNSSKSLHAPIVGSLAGLPGMTHQIRAVLALTMCARWGNDLGPGDKRLADNLQALIGDELSWWCRYIGAIARTLTIVMPAPPTSEVDLHKHILLEPRISHGLGKKGHKVGIRLKIKLHLLASGCLTTGDIESVFDKIGKGLKSDWKVEAEVTN
ncbi:putative retrograde regulation protein 2 [Amylocarpus encephaloides]|uniref:Retrograde regulation protein 2 n=1 Tax=Amylocarpus encephaloides TaxID=45428 RepID=A0A9P8C4F4_9HELO|nr:putative retrograde regulation protein 2 [Amylocarpus encephaloides]